MVAVAFLLSGRTGASITHFMVNGNPTLLVFDANGNGIIPDAGDCVVTGTSSGGSDFRLDLTQQMVPPGVPLQICEPCVDNEPTAGQRAPLPPPPATYSGDGFVSAGSAGASITDTCVVGLGTPMVSVEVRGAGATDGAAGGPVEPLLQPLAGNIFNDGREPRENLGSGLLCSTGAVPGVAVTGRGGLRLLVGLKKLTAIGVDYWCAAVPVPRADTGAIAMVDACVPVDTENKSVLSLGDFALVGIDFGMLPACGGERVPTASEWTLIALALALVAGGTWVLRRRTAFTEAMPQF